MNQDKIQEIEEPSFQMILSGMEMAVLPAVHVAHSTILHISLNNSPALPCTDDDTEARICLWESIDDIPIELTELYVK